MDSFDDKDESFDNQNDNQIVLVDWQGAVSCLFCSVFDVSLFSGTDLPIEDVRQQMQDPKGLDILSCHVVSRTKKKDGVPIGNRSWRLKTYKNVVSFTKSEVIRVLSFFEKWEFFFFC